MLNSNKLWQDKILNLFVRFKEILCTKDLRFSHENVVASDISDLVKSSLHKIGVRYQQKLNGTIYIILVQPQDIRIL